MALTRAKNSIFVVGRSQEMESSDDAKDILAFANSQYEDETKNVKSISSLPLDRSLNDVVNALNSAIVVKPIGSVAAGPSWGGSFYSAPSANYATPRLNHGIGLGGGGSGGGGGGRKVAARE